MPNLLFAGRMLDADPTAFSAIRVMINLNQVGEAAGAAAWLALDGNCTLPEVETGKLRDTLARGGSVMT